MYWKHCTNKKQRVFFQPYAQFNVPGSRFSHAVAK